MRGAGGGATLALMDSKHQRLAVFVLFGGDKIVGVRRPESPPLIVIAVRLRPLPRPSL